MALFISYSHDDNQDPENWVTEFHDRLKKRLRSIKGEEVPILLDRYDLQGNLLEEGLEDLLERTQLLIALISPSYLRKDWCARERRIFIDGLKRKFPNLEKPEERLLAAIKLIEFGFKQVNSEFINSLPDSLKRQRYFEFFSLDRNQNPITLPPHDEIFNVTINDLAHKIVIHLNRLSDRRVSRPMIYLAETIRDFTHYRQRLTKELEAKDYDVLPSAFLPETKEEIETEVRYGITKAILSVHLIGPRFGLTVPGTSNSMTKYQFDLAQELNRPMLTWMPLKMDIQDGNQKRFVDEIRSGLSTNNDLIENSMEDFKIDLFEKLAELKNGKQI